MKYIVITFFCLISILKTQAQEKQEKSVEDTDYIEFNDRNNVVHGVYLGLTAMYGELDGADTYGGGFKIAYVANQKFEVGLAIHAFGANKALIESTTVDNKFGGGYIGIHLEPILFSKRKVSLSFPVFIGVGGLTYYEDGAENFDDDFLDTEFDNFKGIIVVEPGVSALFNVSRYLQLEAGIKYRLTNNFELATSSITNLNGFSAGFGIKVGVFNMGRNRYKKKLKE